MRTPVEIPYEGCAGTVWVTRIAIVGSTSPVGRELQRWLGTTSEGPKYRLSLLDTDEYAGLLEEFQGAVQIVQVISPTRMENADAAVFTCSPELMDQYVSSGAHLPPVTIDLTRSETPGPAFVSGLSAPPPGGTPGRFIAPRAEAIILSTLLGRLSTAIGVDSAEATVLTPASESGRRSVDQLQEETVQILNFQRDSAEDSPRLAFNIRTENSGEARRAAHVARQIGRLSGPSCPAPAIVYGRVPTFEGMAVSLHVRLERDTTREEVLEILTGEDQQLFSYDPKQTSLGVVGEDQAHISLLEEAADANAFWAWIFADSARLAAKNAADLIHTLFGNP
jgi:aspartate-semialdehyde dehydrogenase